MVVRGAGLKTTGLALHEFFVRRAVEALEPGGLAAFVVSRWLLDKEKPEARDQIGDLADFIGAIRLPAGSMKEAGTDVVVDLIFLRRRAEGEMIGGEIWAPVREVETAAGDRYLVNRYFVRHPDMVLGSPRHGKRPVRAGLHLRWQWRRPRHGTGGGNCPACPGPARRRPGHR